MKSVNAIQALATSIPAKCCSVKIKLSYGQKAVPIRLWSEITEVGNRNLTKALLVDAMRQGGLEACERKQENEEFIWYPVDIAVSYNKPNAVLVNWL